MSYMKRFLEDCGLMDVFLHPQEEKDLLDCQCCQWCGKWKENPYGQCEACGRFPTPPSVTKEP